MTTDEVRNKKTILPTGSSAQLSTPNVVVESDDSFHRQSDVVPNFYHEREKYGKPQQVSKADLAKLTSVYVDAQSNSGDLDTIPTPFQNQNSMNVQLSQSGQWDDQQMLSGGPSIDGDSFDEGRGGPQVPIFDLEKDKYGKPVLLTPFVYQKKITSPYNEALSLNRSNEELTVPAELANQNSMKVELSQGEQITSSPVKPEKLDKKKHSKNRISFKKEKTKETNSADGSSKTTDLHKYDHKFKPEHKQKHEHKSEHKQKHEHKSEHQQKPEHKSEHKQKHEHKSEQRQKRAHKHEHKQDHEHHREHKSDDSEDENSSSLLKNVTCCMK